MAIGIDEEIMEMQRYCVRCHERLPKDAPKGICPNCEFRGALSERLFSISDLSECRSEEEFSESPQSFGDYQLIQEIGRGGMGIVYKARQVSLNRIVALKTILTPHFAGKGSGERFRNEAAAAAMLRHLNIVAVHDVGIRDGQPFFSMEYVEGRSLAQLVGSRPLAPNVAARYSKQIAEAIHYAHTQGILHRDLNPSNILIESATDQPRITDFGLAKRIDSASSITLGGQVIGSPCFIPPEQAGKHAGKIGPTSDVYALGALLYYQLTARPPFQAETLEGIVVQLLNSEPVSPRLLNPAIPHDLETICLKCLEKEPSKRYGTAQELAEELDRFRRDEPVRARPISLLEKGARWCRRKPALSSALLLSLVMLLVVTIGSPIAFVRINRERGRVQEQANARRSQLYAAEVNLAFEALAQANLGQARQLLGRQTPSLTETNDLRGFEWRYLYGQCKSDELLTLTHSAELKTWLSFAPDGRNLAIADGDGNVTLWDYRTFQKAAFFPAYTNFARSVHVTERRALAFSKDGKSLAVGVGNTIALWDIASGQQTATLFGHSKTVTHLAFSSNGGMLASASDDATVRLWGASMNPPRWLVTLECECPALAVAFSEDSSLLAVGSKAAVVMLWGLSGSAVPRKLTSLRGMTGWVPGLVFAPAGRRLAAGSGSQLLLWDLDAEGHAYSTNQFHSAGGSLGVIDSISFSPDGQVLVSAGSDRNLTLWDASGTGRAPVKLKGHQGEIYSVGFSNDGHFLASSSQDGTAKIWDTSPLWSGRQKMSHDNWLFAVAFSPDNRLLASLGQDSNVKLWDVASESLLAQRHFPSPGQHLSFSPDGSLLALADAGGVHVLRVSSLEDATNFPGNLIAFSPIDGKLLYSQDQRIFQRDLQTGIVRSWNAQWDGAVSLAISPAGWLAAASPIRHTEQFKIQLWSWSSLNRFIELGRHADRVPGLSFSPDGSWLASASWDGTNRLWSLSNPGQPSLPLQTQSGLAWAVAFAPDGRTLATGGDDSSVRLWHLDSFQQAGTLRGHTASVTALAFSPNGKNLASGSGDGTVRIWRAPTLEEIIRAETSRKETKQ